jgi:hypothetical protein
MEPTRTNIGNTGAGQADQGQSLSPQTTTGTNATQNKNRTTNQDAAQKSGTGTQGGTTTGHGKTGNV